jgi:hypothetical protein
MSVLGQFKSYQMNQTQFLRTLITDDPKGLAKYLVGITSLAGPEALIGTTYGKALREKLGEALNVDPARLRGVANQMGLFVGNQIGIGALPIENLSSLMFVLPGPAGAHVMDVASVVTNRNLSMTSLAQGTFGDQLTPEQWASKATSSFNVQANRVRQMIQSYQTEGPNTRQPRNLTEAFGGAPPTGDAGRPKEPGESLYRGIGLHTPAVQDDVTKRRAVSEDTKLYDDLVRKIALARRAGDAQEVERLNKIGIDKFGRNPVAGAGAMRNAARRTTTPALERQLRNAPKPLRAYERQETK